MRAVPVASAEQPDIIMLRTGMSIRKVISSPVIVPDTVPGMWPGIPEKVMVPVTFDPVCVSCQVIDPMPACPIIPINAAHPAIEANGARFVKMTKKPFAVYFSFPELPRKLFYIVVTSRDYKLMVKNV